ncbi:MAG: metallophosphoesterase [Planctomycetes bacterium]|nr:metallophosphoesterase [Planctomycetota bacterium]
MSSPVAILGLLAVLSGVVGTTFYLQQDRPATVIGLGAMAGDPAVDLKAAAADGRYRFLVAGHVYGRHDHSSGLFAPFEEAWAALPEARRPDFAILTGDVVLRPDAASWNLIDEDLARFGKPVYLAPGNHDGGYAGQDRDVILKRYGARGKAWRLGRDAFLCCDTQRYRGNIDGDDLEALKQLCAAKPRALFVFVHHLVWVDAEKAADPAVKGLVNSVSAGYADKGNFDQVILPLLEKSGAEVFVIAGDVAAGAKVVEWRGEAAPKVHLLASGMGEHPHVGSYLLIDVDDEGIEIDCQRLDQGSHIGKARFPER